VSLGCLSPPPSPLSKKPKPPSNGLRQTTDVPGTKTSCLYLTFRILLFRPMLSRGAHSEAEGSRPAHHYLVECVASATATIAIFDLFRRTFGMDYCVLSQSYSVYIAASVFLLQVQASPNDQQAMRRLNYCIQVLDHVKNFSPSTSDPCGRTPSFIGKRWFLTDDGS
jgi:hypothetical protein